MFRQLKAISGGLAIVMCGCGAEEQQDSSGVEVSGYALEATLNPSGVGESAHTSGAIDRANPFFQALGTNLRTCETCHAPGQGWTFSAEAAKRLFQKTKGTDPLFMVHDSGGNPAADNSTLEARKANYGPTTVEHAVIRFTRTMSPTAEFFATNVVDPYGFSTLTSFSAFRRPSPTANESKVPATGWAGNPVDPFVQVASTSAGATRGHEQRPDPLTTEQINAMRDLQMGVVFAQSIDWFAGRLDVDGAKGGPFNLMAQPFYPGINDLQGNDPMHPGQPFNRKVFNIYDGWAQYQGRPWWDLRAHGRAAIYRGQEIFNNREFDITGVPGLNDLLGQTTVRGTCSTCHNTPNVGGHSVHRMFDIGTADEPQCSPDLVLITLQNKVTGEQRKVCDMGRATGTGKWADLGKFRAPPLRGLAARAPYFHDGSAKDIRAVVKYHDERFNIGLNGLEKLELEQFLGAL
jgi:cytochrome c peroxidase